jgi:hypothetical protein
MTPESLRAELDAEVRAARRITWSLRLSAVAFAAAYLTTVIVLRRMDPFYLLLTLGTLISGASQFLWIERYRVPACLERLARMEPAERVTASPHVEALWPQIRARHGAEIAALGERMLRREEIAALSLADAVVLVAAANRPDYAPRTRRWGVFVICALTAVAVACVLHTPDPA